MVDCGLSGQREDEPSEPAMLAADVVLSACVATLELAPGGGAWHPWIDLPRRLRRCSEWLLPGDGGDVGTTHAAHGLGRTFVDGLGRCWELGAAPPAGAVVPETHALLVGNTCFSHTENVKRRNITPS